MAILFCYIETSLFSFTLIKNRRYQKSTKFRSALFAFSIPVNLSCRNHWEIPDCHPSLRLAMKWMRKANREFFYGNHSLWQAFLLYKFYFRDEITKSYVRKKQVISRCQTLIEFLKNKSSGLLNSTGLGVGRQLSPHISWDFGNT